MVCCNGDRVGATYHFLHAAERSITCSCGRWVVRGDSRGRRQWLRRRGSPSQRTHPPHKHASYLASPNCGSWSPLHRSPERPYLLSIAIACSLPGHQAPGCARLGVSDLHWFSSAASLPPKFFGTNCAQVFNFPSFPNVPIGFRNSTAQRCPLVILLINSTDIPLGNVVQFGLEHIVPRRNWSADRELD